LHLQKTGQAVPWWGTRRIEIVQWKISAAGLPAGQAAERPYRNKFGEAFRFCARTNLRNQVFFAKQGIALRNCPVDNFSDEPECRGSLGKQSPGGGIALRNCPVLH